MIQSMTGYGKAVVTFKEKKINVEIKSLNSKALDLSTRIAPLYREKETDYLYRDSQGILAWMGVRDGENYKFDDTTKNAIFIIQGNGNTPDSGQKP